MSHLTVAQIYEIQKLFQLGHKQKDIASYLGIDKLVLRSELCRNRDLLHLLLESRI